jgi:hypothetical protein
MVVDVEWAWGAVGLERGKWVQDLKWLIWVSEGGEMVEAAVKLLQFCSRGELGVIRNRKGAEMRKKRRRKDGYREEFTGWTEEEDG